jgi:hypothetical protein
MTPLFRGPKGVGGYAALAVFLAAYLAVLVLVLAPGLLGS